MSQEQAPAAYTVEIPGTMAEHRLTIPGRLPGLNEYTDATRTNRHMGAKMKAESGTLVQWSIMQQLRGVAFKAPVFLLFTFYEKDRRRDHDNVSSFARKVIQDALVERGVLIDDGWDCVTGYLDRFVVDNAYPRIEVQFIVQDGEVKCKSKRRKSSRR